MASKPFYRTLRGLDPYSERFCRLLIRRLTAGSAVGAGASVFVNTVAALMLAAMWALVGAVVGPIALGLVWRGLVSSGPSGPLTGGQIGGAAVGAIVGFVVSYRMVSRGMAMTALRDALRPRVIDGWKCMNCRYSLEGLVGKHHLIVCPECGRMVPIGIGSVDLVEQMMIRGELPLEGRFADAGAANRDGAGHE